MSKNKIYISIAAIILIYLIFRIPSLTLQPVFCDEAIYIHWAQKILNNFSLNKFISLSDGKTPLFMWFTAPFLLTFSDPLFAGRMVSVISGLATVFGVIVLGKRFFNFRVGLIAGLMFASVPFFVFFDKLALADSMLVAFSLWSLILALSVVQNPNPKNILFLGLALGGGIITKTPGLFSFVTLPLALLTIKRENLKFAKISKIFLSLASSALIGFGIYSLLRFSPDFVNLSSRNQDYYFPLSRLSQTPLDPFMGHLRDLVDWLPKMLTWPIFVVMGLSIPFIILKKNLTALTILLWGLIPLIPLMLLLKTFTARYVLFCFVPVIFLSAWVIDYIYSLTSFKNKVVPLILIVAVVLIPSFSFDYYLMTNPLKAPLPKEERHGYFEDWTAGYGLKEIAGFLNEKSKTNDILVVTEGSFGTLPDGLDIYLKDNPKIDIWYSTPTLFTEVYEMAAVKPTYFIVNKSRLVLNKDVTLIKEYPKAKTPEGVQDALMLYKVLP